MNTFTITFPNIQIKYVHKALIQIKHVHKALIQIKHVHKA